MPLHRFFYAPGVISQEDKEALAAKITDLYVKGANLPAFYVVVLFIELDKNNVFVGGKPNDKFVRIGVQHLARSFESHKKADEFLKKYEEILAPYIKDKGLDWEVQVEVCDRNLWRFNGLIPPYSGSPEEKEWVRLNKAVPY